jgi:hypothetical protein
MLETLLREMDDQESTTATTASTTPVSAVNADAGNDDNNGDSSSGANTGSEERDSGVPNDDQINKMMAHSPEELEVCSSISTA